MQMLAFEDFYSQGNESLRLLEGLQAEEEGLSLSSLQGRLSEFSSIGTQGAGSLALRYLWQAQQEGFWPVWISCVGLPFVEDLASSGVDTESLPLVRTEEIGQCLRAAERVLRSEVCGLVVVDVGDAQAAPSAMAARLLKLSQLSESACLFLSARSRSGSPSLSPLVSLRLEVSYEAGGAAHALPDMRSLSLDAKFVRDKRDGRRDGFSVRTMVTPGFY